MINNEATEQEYVRLGCKELRRKQLQWFRGEKWSGKTSSDNETQIKKGCETLKPIDVKNTVLNRWQGIQSYQHV